MVSVAPKACNPAPTAKTTSDAIEMRDHQTQFWRIICQSIPLIGVTLGQRVQASADRASDCAPLADAAPNSSGAQTDVADSCAGAASAASSRWLARHP